MIFKTIIWLLIIFFLLRIVFRFFFPIIQITRMTHKQMRRMQDQLKDMANQQANAESSTKRNKSSLQGEYIDYEEIR